MRKLYLLLLSALTALLPLVNASAGRTLDDIRRALMDSSERQVQEKVFIHTDNTCYFVGDTIWYKAYVVRADDLNYTDMSRLLYVELLSPDGLVVERQRVIVSDRGYSCGNFCLKDSLYSGYYELRAYTRWMLNFNVVGHRYSRNDSYAFYSEGMARDYFRQWEGLYSRVLPVYSRPDSAGDYAYKRMSSRHKQHVTRSAAKKLSATFYPEGGHLVAGVPNRVAFELADQDGAAVDLSGRVMDGDTEVAALSTVYMGRGTFTVTPGNRRLKALFAWNGKDYEFELPKAEAAGVSLRLADGRVELSARGLPATGEYGLSVLCRGVLKHFQTVEFDASGHASIPLPEHLPTGVNDVTLFDSDGRILADRLFFVNNHDYDGCTMVVDGDMPTDISPYGRINLRMRCDGIAEPALFSISVRDASTDGPTYDDGDIMTDMLLGSELRGFIASPAYYFAPDADGSRAKALDLLMMVQGWRKYKWQELSDTIYTRRRYTPETMLTVEGCVYKMLSVEDVYPEEIEQWQKGQGFAGTKMPDDEDAAALDGNADGGGETDTGSSADDFRERTSVIEYGNIGNANDNIGVDHGSLKSEVVVEAEISFGTEVVGATQMTHDGGRFIFQVPPYYGDAVLNMKAYKAKDSLTKSMAARKDKYAMNEDALPDFYVKRDVFYPVFAEKYSYYQTHEPETTLSSGGEEQPQLSMDSEDHLLQNLDVKGKKRGKRAIDFNSPVYVRDAYALYNDITDYGLSFGKFDMRQFPVQVARFLYGNMGRYNRFNVDGRIDRYTYYRNYQPDLSDPNKIRTNRNAQALYDRLKLKAMRDIRVFTDYEPRNEDAPMVLDRLNADVTVEIVPYADGVNRYSFRDRHIILHGIDEPADFYCPDYSERRPEAPADYRRTLYWNPNAQTDSDGRFAADFYNNGKDTRIKISVAGIAPDGRFIRCK